jgi:alkylhydroperoxidase family enzyme
MPRYPYPDAATLSDAAKAELASLAPLNIFRMLAHDPKMLKPFTEMGGRFLLRGRLDPVLRECVILRVGYLSNATYEFTQHEAIGRKLGMDEALFSSLRAGAEAAGLTPEQAEAVRFTDDVVRNVRASDATLTPILKRYGPAGTNEMILLVGYYMMVSRFLETTGVEVEEGGPGGAAILNETR